MGGKGRVGGGWEGYGMEKQSKRGEGKKTRQETRETRSHNLYQYKHVYLYLENPAQSPWPPVPHADRINHRTPGVTRRLLKKPELSESTQAVHVSIHVFGVCMNVESYSKNILLICRDILEFRL